MIVYYSRKIQCLFVPKFYHDRNKRNFLKNLKYIGEYDKFDRKIFFEFRDLLGKNIRVTKYGSDKELPPPTFSPWEVYQYSDGMLKHLPSDALKTIAKNAVI